MGDIPIPADAEMMWRAVNQAFVNQINVIVNYLGKFDANTIALLADADYKQRRQSIGVITGCYMRAMYRKIRIEWAKAEDEYFLELCYIKVAVGKEKVDEKTGEKKRRTKKVCTDETEAAIWRDMRARAVRLEFKNDSVIEMAKASLALFRHVGITEAFEAYEETVADLLGVEKRGVAKAKAAVDQAAVKKSFKERLAEKMEKAKQSGVLSEKAPLAEQD